MGLFPFGGDPNGKTKSQMNYEMQTELALLRMIMEVEASDIYYSSSTHPLTHNAPASMICCNGWQKGCIPGWKVSHLVNSSHVVCATCLFKTSIASLFVLDVSFSSDIAVRSHKSEFYISRIMFASRDFSGR